MIQYCTAIDVPEGDPQRFTAFLKDIMGVDVTAEHPFGENSKWQRQEWIGEDSGMTLSLFFEPADPRSEERPFEEILEAVGLPTSFPAFFSDSLQKDAEMIDKVGIPLHWIEGNVKYAMFVHGGGNNGLLPMPTMRGTDSKDPYHEGDDGVQRSLKARSSTN